MTLGMSDLEKHLQFCQNGRAQQELRVGRLREEVKTAEIKLSEWDGAIQGAKILIDQTQKADPAGAAGAPEMPPAHLPVPPADEMAAEREAENRKKAIAFAEAKRKKKQEREKERARQIVGGLGKPKAAEPAPPAQ